MTRPAASCFYPTAEWAQDVYWLHKRAPSGRWSIGQGDRKRPLRHTTTRWSQ